VAVNKATRSIDEMDMDPEHVTFASSDELDARCVRLLFSSRARASRAPRRRRERDASATRHAQRRGRHARRHRRPRRVSARVRARSRASFRASFRRQRDNPSRADPTSPVAEIGSPLLPEERTARAAPRGSLAPLTSRREALDRSRTFTTRATTRSSRPSVP
jgi:hypothetical protein